MKFLSVFSGIEAASVAWKDLGWEAVAFSEIDPWPSALLSHHYPKIPNYGNITQHHTWPITPGSIDLLIGGSPCQAFSIAGDMLGLADPRGNLALTFVQLAARLQARWVVWENVQNAISSNGGRDFAAIISAFSQLGYGLCWRVLDCTGFGLPQRRKRLFLICHLGSWQPAFKVLFDSTKGAHLEGNSGSQEQANPSLYLTGDKQSNRVMTFQPGNLIRQAGARPSDKHITTLKASSGDQCPWICTEEGIRTLTPIDYERLQGFPDNYTRIPYKGADASACSDSKRFKALGNSMATPVIKWIGERIKAIDQEE